MLASGQLTWPDGQDAGVVVDSWATVEQPRELDERACFVPDIGCTPAWALEFCIDRARVEEIANAGLAHVIPDESLLGL